MLNDSCFQIETYLTTKGPKPIISFQAMAPTVPLRAYGRTPEKVVDKSNIFYSDKTSRQL